MSIHFRTAALIGKPADCIAETLTELHLFLLRQGLRVLVEQDSARFIGGETPPETADWQVIGASCDFAVAVGGDGTLLSAARELADFDVPLIGVNLGRLGFLVDISPHDIAAHLGEILKGHYVREERFMLSANLVRDGEVIYSQTAVNEVVVQRWNSTSMIEIETSINGAFLNVQRSDGLIVSSPTGSTAYALSAGGPILSPNLKALVLAPINSHTLTSRPIVVESSSVIEVAFRPSRQFSAQIVCDNVSNPEVRVTDRVNIRLAPRPFHLLHSLDYDFFGILRAKLNWSSGYRN